MVDQADGSRPAPSLKLDPHATDERLMEALIGRLAIQRGLLTMEQLAVATQLQARKRDGQRLGQVLVELGYLNLEQLNALLSDQRRGITAPLFGPSAPPTASGPHTAPLDHALNIALKMAADELWVWDGGEIWARRPEGFDRLEGLRLSAAATLEALSPEARRQLEAHGLVSQILERGALGRWRLRLTREGEALSCCAQRLPSPHTIADLKLPARLALITHYPQGLFLISGPRRSGKTSALGALMRILNEERSAHVIAFGGDLPRPRPRRALLDVWPREADREAQIRAALRMRPDALIFDPLDGPAAVEGALLGAESGALVFATVPALSPEGALEQLIALGPEHLRDERRARLADHLLGLLEVRRVPKARGGHRLVWGQLTPTPTLTHLIRAEQLHRIEAAQRQGGAAEDVPLDAALQALVSAGEITLEAARAAAHVPQRLRDA